MTNHQSIYDDYPEYPYINPDRDPKWFKKLEHQRQIKNIALVIVGAFLLALGTGMFLTPNITNSNLGNFEGINAGGLGGSGLIVQNQIGRAHV